MRTLATAGLLITSLVLGLSCQESPETPPQPVAPTLKLLAGAGVTDTIDTAPVQGLVAQVTGTDGKPERGVAVDFEVPQDVLGGRGPRIMLSPDGTVYQSVVAVITDAQGRAVVRVRFGTVAGPARVTAIVPVHGLADTADYTITPGAPAGLQVFPRDTAVEVQGTFSMNASVVDRGNNPRNGPVTYEVSSGVARVDASGVVTGVGVGRAFVRARATAGTVSVVDSAGVSVVPAARIVYETTSRGALQISNLTGTWIRTVVSYPAGAGAWSPTRDRIAFCHDPFPVWDIGVTDTLGNATLLTRGAGGCWPQFSPDGQWIYYHDRSDQIRRIHPDGTAVDSLFTGSFVTTAPDGYRVAFQRLGVLTIGDVRTRSAVAVAGVTDVHTPRWSPDGQMIAYVTSNGDGVRIVRPDGSRVRDFPGSYDTGLGWSPDSRFIVVSTGSRLILLDVTTGTTLPVPVAGLYPNWAP